MTIRNLTVLAALAVLTFGPALAVAQQPAPKAPAAKTPAPKGAQPKAAPTPAAPPKPAGPTPEEIQAQTRAVMDPSVEAQLAQLGIFQGLTGARTIRGRLANGARTRVTVEAGPGVYGIGGFCEDACGDIDLRAYGPDGASVGSAEGPDKHPAFLATVTGNAKFDLEIDMKTCSTTACAWAIQISAKAP